MRAIRLILGCALLGGFLAATSCQKSKQGPKPKVPDEYSVLGNSGDCDFSPGAAGMGGVASECWEEERDLYLHVRAGAGYILEGGASDSKAGKDAVSDSVTAAFQASFGTAVGAHSGTRIGLDVGYTLGFLQPPSTSRACSSRSGCPKSNFAMTTIGPGLHQIWDLGGPGLVVSGSPSLAVVNFRAADLEGSTYRDYGFGAKLGIGVLFNIGLRPQSFAPARPWNQMGVLSVSFDPTLAAIGTRVYFSAPISVGVSL